MEMPAATQGRRTSTVVDRKLDELCACLVDALSSGQQTPHTDEQLRAKIKSKTEFLRLLLYAEAECHGGPRPEHLAEAEARFAVLAATFDGWARRAVVAAPEPVEEEEADSLVSSRSACFCTDSCQEEATEGDAIRDAMEARNEEGTLDAVAKKGDIDHEAAVETGSRVVQRRWWRHNAAACRCSAAGLVVVVAIASKTNSAVRDLRQLVGSLGLGAREPEREGWEHVISKSSDDVSYKAWCDKPTVVANCVHALQQIWALEAANLVAERLRHCIANHWIDFNMQMESLFWQQLKFFSIPMTVVHQQQEKKEDKSDKTEDEKN
ncbi:OSJNBa0010H02.21-like protein [Zea mays]|uniref:OSJNBa0010H02.21-like protein n=1 Tax=Zea mays TaxID=4577 RepID=A0A1D6JD43_MAIZE|nr:OSJNBa0010H02.21-like protein [Zea mays]